MTKEIIEMARDSGMELYGLGKNRARFVYHLEAFAKLVAEAESRRYMQLFLDPENQPTQFGTATQEYRDKEIKEEREECAKLADDIDPVWHSISDAIRARGQA